MRDRGYDYEVGRAVWTGVLVGVTACTLATVYARWRGWSIADLQVMLLFVLGPTALAAYDRRRRTPPRPTRPADWRWSDDEKGDR